MVFAEGEPVAVTDTDDTLWGIRDGVANYLWDGK
jgi:hypothetical protein